MDYLTSYITPIIVALIVIYLGISIAVYFIQDYVLFRPEKLHHTFNFEYSNLAFQEYLVEIKPGVTISGIRFRCDSPKGVVFYLKGNSKSIKGWGKFAIDFIRYHYDVIMVDYRGFGKSTGIRTQEEIIEDLQAIYNKIKEKVDENFIILYGRSMGSGFATKLASKNNPGMLILDAPYYSMSKTTSRYLPFLPMSWLLKFPIPTYKWIKYVRCPIHILHGTKDRLIPFSSSIKLASIHPKSTNLHPIIGGGHNNLHNFESYHQTLSEIFTLNKFGFNAEKSSLHYKPKQK